MSPEPTLKYPSPETIMAGPQAGAFFENMVVIETLKRKFNRGLLYELYFYRDSNHNDIDLVLDFGRKFVLVEVKSTKNITAKLADFAGRAPFKDRPAYVVTFSERELPLAPGVKAIPWQTFDPAKL